MSEQAGHAQAGPDVAGVYRSATGAYTYVMRQPSWVLRLALLAAGAVVLAVLAVIIIPALIVGLVVFAAGVLWARVRRWIGGSRVRRNDASGRENVRVIVRSDGQ